MSSTVKKRDRKKITVYPSPLSLAITGHNTAALNRAIECWAVVLRSEARDMEELLSPEDWELLADAVDDLPGTEYMFVAEWLAGKVVDAVNLGGAEATQEHVRSLLGKLKRISYQQAWAILWAVSGRQDATDKEWWKLSNRTKAK